MGKKKCLQDKKKKGEKKKKRRCEWNREQSREMPVHKCFMAAEGGL